MNTHEIERIAAAMNMLRPDWPTRQLKTLLADQRIAERPRRDVCVALAWVACESGTANPYRVLESGPWWRAAAVEGAASRREVLNPAERCGICSERQDRCRSLWAGDHEFEPDFKHGGDPEALALINAALKAEIQPTAAPPPRKSLDDLLPEQRDPRAEDARAEIAAEEEG